MRVVLIATVSTLIGCGGGPFHNRELNSIVTNATEVMIYSLDPNVREPTWKSDEHPSEESFHEYQILGSATLKEPDELEQVVNSLRTGLSANATAAKCFEPRHGLRFESHGHTYDLVICFQCNQIYVYYDGERLQTLLTENSAQQTFNEILSKHKIKLSPVD